MTPRQPTRRRELEAEILASASMLEPGRVRGVVALLCPATLERPANDNGSTPRRRTSKPARFDDSTAKDVTKHQKP